MRLGFTGTREGMSQEQADVVVPWIVENANNFVEAHHGDCIGADAQFDGLLLQHCPDLWRDIHPPLKAKYRAFCQEAKARVHKAKDYYARNRDIVEASTWLIATPLGFEPGEGTGGTWYTVKYAWERQDAGQDIRVMVVYRDGEVVVD